MASSMDFPARGKVIRVEGESVIFAPLNTTYEIKLLAPGGYSGPMNWLIEAHIRANARKLWTVSSGGNFLTPIQGPPRILQGRVKFLDEKMMVVEAGTTVILRLPGADDAYDLNNGQIAVGALVNATILPGATFELAGALAGAK